MINLPECTFVIPCRKDCADRENNLNLVLDFINTYIKTNLMVWEIDTEQKMEYLKDKCDYQFIKVDEPFFHKAQYLNMMIKQVNTPVINIQDTDILLNPYQWVIPVKLILEQNYEMVLPYNMYYYQINKKYHNQVRKKMSVINIPEEYLELIFDRSCGGSIFFSTQAFKAIGGLNPNFRSLGGQDTELVVRAFMLNLKVRMVKDNLYHLEHFRKCESLRENKGTKKYNKSNMFEYDKIRNMDVEQLKQYIKSWQVF